MQGPHLSAKPRHFCNLDMATSKKTFLDLKLYVLQLQFHKIKGSLKYKITALTPPNIHITWYIHDLIQCHDALLASSLKR